MNVTAWGFDPALAIALRYACAEKLVNVVGGGYELTEIGRIFASSIMDENDVLEHEKVLLKDIGKNISEGMVDEVAKGWETK